MHYSDATSCGRHGVPIHWQFYCWFNVFRLTREKTSKLCITVPLRGESTGDSCILYPKGQWCGKRFHDDVIKWKNFPRYWPFVRGIHRSPVNSPHKGQWLGALMFSLIYARINGWVNTGDADDLRRYHAHHDVIAMSCHDVTISHDVAIWSARNLVCKID